MLFRSLQTLVAASPSVIYTTTQAQDGYACRFVSENLTPIMGYLPWEMRDNSSFYAKHVHPDDAEHVFSKVKQLIAQGAEPSSTASATGGVTMSGSRTASRSYPTRKAGQRTSLAHGQTSPTASVPRTTSSGSPRRWSGTTDSFARPLAGI